MSEGEKSRGSVPFEVYFLCFYYTVFYFLIKEFRKITYLGFLDGAIVKNLPANAGGARDMCSIPGLRRSLGIGNGSPLQYSYLENSMDRGGQLEGYSLWGHKELEGQSTQADECH